MIQHPQPHEVEISIFGPNYGESIAIHATEGRWIIIDSCFSSDKKQSRPIEYLTQIGVDVSTAVKLVLATHWDDDHIGGLSECLERCTSANFALSSAIASGEFLSLIRITDSNFLGKMKNVKEFSKILKILESRSLRPTMAIEKSEIWSDPKSQNPNLKPKLLALSPSSTTVINGHVNIAQLFKEVKKTPNRPIPQNRNERSVVALLEVGSVTVLLGADLEESGDQNTGWSAILNLNPAPAKSQVFKIPHHGSNDADHPAIWTSLLKPEPIAVLTPWQKGGRTLPCSGDVKRLQSYTKQLFVTALPHNHQIKRPKIVQNLINASGAKLRKTNKIGGHIRLRADARQTSPQWSSVLLGGASKIEDKMYKAFPKE